MTDKIQQARRAAFEAKYPLPVGMYWCAETNQYAGNPQFWLCCDRLEVFNTALDCVVIELPADCKLSRDGLDKCYLAGQMRDDILAAIESTNLGIKVK